ncbi:SOS response-associated peptidase [Bacillus sp. AK128]
MCGRFTLYSDFEEIIERFMIDEAIQQELYKQSYNIAPTHSVLSVINDGKKNRLGYLRWGLIPPWAKDIKIGTKMINARGESLHEKPSFRKAYQSKRCLVLANSFYEWKTENGIKTPMCIKLRDSNLFAMAGLWESWKSTTGERIFSCTVITTTPNELMENIHNRMPVILKPEDESKWIDPTIKDYRLLNHLLDPLPSELMEAYQVSSLVNSPKNNSNMLISEIC